MRLRTDHPAWARAGLVARWVTIVGACYLGGVAATNLSPTTVETSNYRATLRLDPVPRHTPVLHSPTIVGDVDLAFRSPTLAPGLDVAVSVREEVTDLLTAGPVSVRSLQPTDAEIDAAIAAAMAEAGTPTIKQMGLVMKAAQAKLAGKRVDGKALSDRVRAKLS